MARLISTLALTLPLALAACGGGGSSPAIPTTAAGPGQQRGGITVDRVPLMDPAPASGDVAPPWNGQTFTLSPCVPVRDFSTWPTMSVVGSTCGPIVAPPYQPPSTTNTTAYYQINGVNCYAEAYRVSYSASGAIAGFYCLTNPFNH